MSQHTILALALFCVLPLQAGAQGINSWQDTYGKSPTEFTVEEWRQIVDDHWGPGMDTPSKLAFFDQWYTLSDSIYAAFQGLDFDIDAFRDTYRPEVEAGIGRGRFAGIMSHFAFGLQDLHTYLFDIGVRNTPRAKGVPQLYVGQFGSNNGFGAVLTPLPDSTLVAYRVLNNHPLGLEPGDVVLGYDGMLWKDIYPKLLEAQLPLFVNSTPASNDESNAYYLLSAAGLNWHLFDTIDILQYSTGDTLHLETNLLRTENRTIWAQEGMDIPGVSWPDRNVDRVSFGVVDGTNVGYVYVTSWSFDALFNIREQFRQAIVNLWFTQVVDALIFDFRFNTGGGALAREGLQLLFNAVTPTVGFDIRADPNDRFSMEEDPLRRATNLVIRPDETTFWEKPIAVLIGPGAISAGELEARRLSFHPRTRIFGLPAAGGNTGSICLSSTAQNCVPWPSVNRPEWFASLATSNQFEVEGHRYLAHESLQPDERVWLDRDDVAAGDDTVVEAALRWIEREIVSTEPEVPIGQALLRSFELYPNPFAATLGVEVEVETSVDLEVIVSDVLGRRVATLASGRVAPGTHRYAWNGRDGRSGDAAPGIYFLTATAGATSLTRAAVKTD